MAERTPSDMTREEIEALEAVARAATPEVWCVSDEESCYNSAIGCEIIFDEGLICDTAGSTCGEDEDAANARHIAAFDPPTALRLIATITSANARADALARDLAERDATIAAMREAAVEAMARALFDCYRGLIGRPHLIHTADGRICLVTPTRWRGARTTVGFQTALNILALPLRR